ncbi:hypothetical protein CHARACLAT_029406, partial [Characodon lateralis]|nr:hypothetical protein [Characodon lateralis]
EFLIFIHLEEYKKVELSALQCLSVSICGDFQVQASKLLQPSALAQSLSFGSCLSQSFKSFKKLTWLKY